jgi:hypothetical protein
MGAMAGVVNLRDIVDELSMMFDEMKSFVNRDTGEVITVSCDELRDADEETGEDEMDEMTDAEAEAVNPAWSIAKNPGRYARLPSRHEVNAWETLREFCMMVEPPIQRGRLLAAIQGHGAFRRFKDLASEYGLLDEWYAFQEDALRDIAREWCEESGIPHTDNRGSDKEFLQPRTLRRWQT